MAETTVKDFAETVGIPVERLLSQLEAAGVERRDVSATLSDEDKAALLAYLRQGQPETETEGGDAAPPKITLKRRSHSQLRMPAGTGAGTRGTRQTRTVNVEVRRRRTYVKRSAVEAEELKKDAEHLERVLEEDERRRQEEEERARQEAAAAAEAAAAEAEKAAAESAEESPEDVERRVAEEAATAQAEALKEKPKSQQDEAKKREEERERKRAEQEAKREREAEERAARKQQEAAKPKKRKKEGDQLSVGAGRGAGRRKRKGGGVGGEAAKQLQQSFERPTAPVIREVEIPDTITVGALADKMSVKAAALIKEMMKQGVMATINQAIDQATAAILVEELGHKPKLIKDDSLEDELLRQADEPEGEQVSRAPVVTVMGHVDHGKTSLLDHIRRTRVAEAEAGGITQHIGAYRVATAGGQIAFLDTPGHQAFTAMRARGAHLTDIVVLVVAADDGVMPQTKEAVEHARAAGVPIVVAVNKIDKEEADPDRVKQELAQMEVIPEEWGGDTQFIHVSAITGQGMDELLEAIQLQAEVLELTAVKDCPAQGIVLESSLDRGRGPVATVLVQNGYLHQGDTVICGTVFGRVRAMLNEQGARVDEAGPSTPVVILGLSGLPESGDDLLVVDDERKAREVAEYRTERQRDKRLAQQQAARMEDLFSQMKEEEVNTVHLVLKADVHGTAEALRQSLEDLSTDEVRVKVVSAGVGAINESDVNLTQASNAILIGFNVRADASARRMIQESGVDLHYYSVIYDAIEQVKNAISGMLEPELEERILGVAEVKDVFRSSKLGAVAGCLVVEGVVRRTKPIRVLRDNVVIFEGQLESLRRFKDDVSEVRAGTECGIGVKSYNDVQPSDQIECFERFEVERTL